MRPFLKNRLSALTAWLKRHPLIGTALGLSLVYLAYEFCTTFLVICRDAYVTADIVAVSPEVSGPMLRLAVTDNQSVAAGDLLFTIDPGPYQIELDREKAALALAQANLSGAKDRLVLAQNNIDGKKATFDDATINRDRGLQLLKQNVVSEETIKSPARGRVAPFQIRPGTFLEVGKSVLAIVTADNWRVMANLPERHLSGLQVGQPVWVSMGSDPWRIYTGHIRSIAPVRSGCRVVVRARAPSVVGA